MDGRPNPGRSAADAQLRLRLGAVLVAVAVLAAGVLAAFEGDLLAGEQALFEAGNDLPRPIGVILQAVMSAGTSLAAVAVVAVAIVTGRRRLAAEAGLAWLGARLLSTLLKAAVDRPRPPDLLDGVTLRQDLPGDAGFPSSHTAIAVALALAAGHTWPRLQVPLLVLAALVAVARLYVGVHLPLDLVGGAALGVVCGVGALAGVEAWTRRAGRPPHDRPDNSP